MKISAAANTEIPALLVLEAKGFKITCSEDGSVWNAISSKNEFTAESTLKLLGLVEMFNSRGEQWKAEDADIERCITKYPGFGG